MTVKTLTSATPHHQKLTSREVQGEMLYHHKEYIKLLTLCMLLMLLRMCVRVMKVDKESHLFADHPKELNLLDNHQANKQPA